MNLKFIISPSLNVPTVLAPTDQLQKNPDLLLNLISHHRPAILEQLNHTGAVLFRNFNCQTADHFSKAIELINLGHRCSTSDYNLPRTVLANEIYTSSDLPGNIPLPLHHEKPRSPNPPHHIYFCCVTPANKGGGTIFANSAAIWLDMPKQIQENVSEHGVLYKQFFHGQSVRRDLIHYLLKKTLGQQSTQQWSEYFATNDKKQIEDKLTLEKISWDWVNHKHDLILTSHLPGAVNHPVTNQTLWFNSSAYLNHHSNFVYGELKTLPWYQYLAGRYLVFTDRLPMVCHYGNGLAFSENEITEINQIIQQHSYTLNWQQGDFMIVDNFTFMHGKETHEGDRLLYSCMTQRSDVL